MVETKINTETKTESSPDHKLRLEISLLSRQENFVLLRPRLGETGQKLSRCRGVVVVHMW